MKALVLCIYISFQIYVYIICKPIVLNVSFMLKLYKQALKIQIPSPQSHLPPLRCQFNPSRMWSRHQNLSSFLWFTYKAAKVENLTLSNIVWSWVFPLAPMISAVTTDRRKILIRLCLLMPQHMIWGDLRFTTLNPGSATNSVWHKGCSLMSVWSTVSHLKNITSLPH